MLRTSISALTRAASTPPITPPSVAALVDDRPETTDEDGAEYRHVQVQDHGCNTRLVIQQHPFTDEQQRAQAEYGRHHPDRADMRQQARHDQHAGHRGNGRGNDDLWQIGDVKIGQKQGVTGCLSRNLMPDDDGCCQQGECHCRRI
jgi:hypothetical protein